MAKDQLLRNEAMPLPTAQAIEVFFSYAHEDEDLRNELEKHLKLLQRQGVIEVWHDREISAGTEWAGEIDEHLNTAQIILLLISADFLASDYCYDIELTRAMERHAAQEARVIPVILRDVDWNGAPFGELQALPKDALPVTRWSNIDEAFANLAEGIREVVVNLLNGTTPEHQMPPSKLSNVPKLPPIIPSTEEGRISFKEHKYNGELVGIELKFSDEPESAEKSKIGIRLDVTFGGVEEKFIYKNGVRLSKPKEGYIRFGIKHGKLCLNLTNGAIPLGQRKRDKDPDKEWLVSDEEWQVITTGVSESPVWEFEPRGTPAVLRGTRVNKKLGIVNLLDTFCIV